MNTINSMKATAEVSTHESSKHPLLNSHTRDSVRLFGTALLGIAFLTQSASARLYDRFDSSVNWALAANGGTAAIGSSYLTLSSPAGVLSNPTATLNSNQALTGSRQSILARSHSGSVNKTVFFLWATDPATGNKLELKIDDVTSTTVVAGYYSGGGTTYHYVGSVAYSPGSDGLYLAFKESGGTTYWEISTDANTWTDVGTLANPVSTSSMTFQVQHKAYSATSSATTTIVDCFNYKATGAGYRGIEDKTYSGGDGWELYREAFLNGQYACQNGTCDTHITVNGVDSTQHFTDTTIPQPRANTSGYDFRIVSTDQPTSNWYDNAYRYQNLSFVDADNWTYTMYFKYAYPQYIHQGLEFPLNKYTGSHRIQAAVAWYPNRPDTGSHTGKWSVWGGSTWIPTGLSQTLQPGQWYQVTFTVGLHDDTVYYSGFKAGSVGSLTSFAWNASYAAPANSTPAAIVPAVQMDDNIDDTTVAGTQKDCYVAEWNVTWTDEKLH
jgi:hypothetical protein